MKRKTSLLLASVIFFGTLLLAYFIGHAVRSQFERDQGYFLSEIANQFAGKLDQGINARFGEIKTLASLDAIANPKYSLSSKREVLEKLSESFPEFAWIGIADARGQVLVSSRNILLGADVSQRPWFQRGRSQPTLVDVHDAVLLNKVLGGSEKEPLRFIDCAAPVYYDGKFVGVLVGHLSWHWAESISQELMPPSEDQSFRLTIFSKDGKVLIGNKEQTAPDFSKVLSAQGYYIDRSSKVLVGVAKTQGNQQAGFEDLGWIVTVERDTDSAFALAYSLEFKILAGGLLLAMLSAILGLRYKIHQERAQSLSENLNEVKAAEISARRSNEAKSQFMAAMSHEIRTPMHGVLGVTDLLLETPLNADQRRYASLIKSSAESLLAVINDVLDYSKIHTNQIELDSEPFLVSQVIEQTVNLMRPEANLKSLNLHVYDTSPSQLVVIGDPRRLRQVLLNLIGNAIKFTHHGAIDIFVSQEKEDAKYSYYKIQIRDSGIGISEKNQQRIFERFEQVDRSPSRKFGGTGLGLTVSKSIVKLMGGDMGVFSQEGEGSTFWFTVCLRKQEPGAAVSVLTEVAPPIQKLKILAAEDNKVNQLIIRSILEKMGHEIVLVENGREVLDVLAKENFDLILMDCHMPEMDGYLTTQVIRQKAGLKDLPIIAMTASAMVDERDRCFQVGMNDYISKPLNFMTVRDVLKKYGKLAQG